MALNVPTARNMRPNRGPRPPKYHGSGNYPLGPAKRGIPANTNRPPPPPKGAARAAARAAAGGIARQLAGGPYAAAALAAAVVLGYPLRLFQGETNSSVYWNGSAWEFQGDNLKKSSNNYPPYRDSTNTTKTATIIQNYHAWQGLYYDRYQISAWLWRYPLIEVIPPRTPNWEPASTPGVHPPGLIPDWNVPTLPNPAVSPNPQPKTYPEPVPRPEPSRAPRYKRARNQAPRPFRHRGIDIKPNGAVRPLSRPKGRPPRGTREKKVGGAMRKMMGIAVGLASEGLDLLEVMMDAAGVPPGKTHDRVSAFFNDERYQNLDWDQFHDDFRNELLEDRAYGELFNAMSNAFDNLLGQVHGGASQLTGNINPTFNS